MTTVGIYLGTSAFSPQNIHNQLIAWGDYLSPHRTIIFGSAGPLPKEIEERFDTCIKYHNESPKNPIERYNLAFQECRRVLKSDNFDVLVQITNYPIHAPAVSLAGKMDGVNVITRFSGDHFKEYAEFSLVKKLGVLTMHNLIGRLPIKLSDKMIALGPNGQSELQQRGAARDQVTILPPAIGNDNGFHSVDNKAKYKNDLGLSNDRMTVLYVGRISDRKGMDFLIDVIDEIDSPSNYQFVIVGKGERREYFRKNYDSKFVYTPGYVDHKEIDRWYKSADVYIHPSQYEGIPLTILEALKCGIPVVARRAGDIDLVTSNIVDRPKEMVDIIKSDRIVPEFQNKELFKYKRQKEILREIIGDLS